MLHKMFCDNETQTRQDKGITIHNNIDQRDSKGKGAILVYIVGSRGIVQLEGLVASGLTKVSGL